MDPEQELLQRCQARSDSSRVGLKSAPQMSLRMRTRLWSGMDRMMICWFSSRSAISGQRKRPLVISGTGVLASGRRPENMGQLETWPCEPTNTPRAGRAVFATIGQLSLNGSSTACTGAVIHSLIVDMRMQGVGELTDHDTHWYLAYDDCSHGQVVARVGLEEPERAARFVRRYFAQCLTCRLESARPPGDSAHLAAKSLGIDPGDLMREPP
jgi:hypothetical protein